MTAYLLIDHVMNFLAPAACVALLVALLARMSRRFFKLNMPLAQPMLAQTATIFIVNTAILLAGLAFFGNDGKMATYAAMVLGSAVCQWTLWRGWLR